MKHLICCFLVGTLMLGSTGWWSQASAQSKDLRVNLAKLSDEELQALYIQTVEKLFGYCKGVLTKLGEIMGVTIPPDKSGGVIMRSLYPNLTKALDELLLNILASGGNKDSGFEVDPTKPDFPEGLVTIFLFPDRIAEAAIRNDVSRAAPWLSEDELEFVVNEFSDRLKAEEAANAAREGNYLASIWKAVLLANELALESKDRARQRRAAYEWTQRLLPFRPFPRPREGSGTGGGGRRNGNGGTPRVGIEWPCFRPVWVDDAQHPGGAWVFRPGPCPF